MPIVRVSEAFVDLQQHRHDADYDHLATFSKATVLTAVAQSRSATEDLANERDTDGYVAFMGLLTLGARDLR